MSVKKLPTTHVVYLGIVCESDLCRFEVPDEKLAKLAAIITVALETGLITFAM